jgi:hypothetical protein
MSQKTIPKQNQVGDAPPSGAAVPMKRTKLKMASTMAQMKVPFCRLLQPQQQEVTSQQHISDS